MNNTQQLILASQSPRRKQLLLQIGIKPICQPVDIDESIESGEKPLKYCRRLASEKAQVAWDKSSKKLVVLGSDTIVVLNGHALGKPIDENDAMKMLEKLSGQTHQVITAVAMINARHKQVIHSISNVCFARIDGNEIKNYVQSQEPMDKAGSYAIQGYAAKWIKSISGSYSGIMGLPLYETAQLWRDFQ